MWANDGTIYINYYVAFRLDEVSDRKNAIENYCCLKTQIEIKTCPKSYSAPKKLH